jgi:hypothetical protein
MFSKCLKFQLSFLKHLMTYSTKFFGTGVILNRVILYIDPFDSFSHMSLVIKTPCLVSMTKNY